MGAMFEKDEENKLTRLEQKDLDKIIEEKESKLPDNFIVNKLCIDITDRIIEGDYVIKVNSEKAIIFVVVFTNCKVCNVTFDWSDNIYSFSLYFEFCDVYGYVIKSKKLKNVSYGSSFKHCSLNEFIPHSYERYHQCEVYPPVPYICPEEGEFIAWKVVLEVDEYGGADSYRILKLIVPADAKRSSGFGRKCKCSKALPVELYDLEGNVIKPKGALCSYYRLGAFTYTLGEMAYPNWFDEDRYLECSYGIHFFMSFDEAFDYYKENF